MPIDPIELTRALIRCVSVTPADDGALDIVNEQLSALGFTVHRLDFDGTPNLFARRGATGPHLCFAGHTDVVPAGDAGWSDDPFAANVVDGDIVGRGSSDMKGAIAAFIAAVSQLPDAATGDGAAGDGASEGSISLLITGDEEGPADGGTVRVLEWMDEHGHIPDFCVVGEASNASVVGDTIKVGRRGSVNVWLTVRGTQGHVAYPHLSVNPVHQLTRALHELITVPLDDGSEFFEPSNLQVTTIDVGNGATNVVPATASAHLNIRFNDRHTGASLSQRVREVVERFTTDADVEIVISGESFVTPPGEYLTMLAETVASVTGVTPQRDTRGGTSDARFISRYAPVAEFGLVSATIHKADERARVSDVHLLAEVYRSLLVRFLKL